MLSAGTVHMIMLDEFDRLGKMTPVGSSWVEW